MTKPLVFLLLDTPPAALGLSGDEQLILLKLAGHLNSKRNGTEVWPSIGRITWLTGKSESSVRRALRRFSDLGLVKMRSDPGKSNTYTINVDAIRCLADPCHTDRGTGPDPCHTDTPPLSHRQGTPVTVTPEQLKNSQRNNQALSPFGCSANLKVSDGDHQRKLAVHGLVSEATESLSTARSNDDNPDRLAALKAAKGQ